MGTGQVWRLTPGGILKMFMKREGGGAKNFYNVEIGGYSCKNFFKFNYFFFDFQIFMVFKKFLWWRSHQSLW